MVRDNRRHEVVLAPSFTTQKDGGRVDDSYISKPFLVDRKGRDVSYDAPVVKAHQFPQHFEFNAVGIRLRDKDRE